VLPCQSYPLLRCFSLQSCCLRGEWGRSSCRRACWACWCLSARNRAWPTPAATALCGKASPAHSPQTSLPNPPPPPASLNRYIISPSPPAAPNPSQCGWCGSLLNGDSTQGICLSQADADSNPSLCRSQPAADHFRAATSDRGRKVRSGCDAPQDDLVLLAFVLGLFYAATLLNAVALAHFVKKARRGTCAQVALWFIVALCCSFLAWVLVCTFGPHGSCRPTARHAAQEQRPPADVGLDSREAVVAL
jgi:hypothetical protein